MTLPDHLLTLDAIMLVMCCLAVLYGAMHDVAARTVPNTVCALIGLFGLWHAQICHLLLLSSIVALIIFTVGGCAWRASLLGGGDVKLLAASSLWIEPFRIPLLLGMVTLAGGILACIYLVLQRVLPRPSGRRPHSFTGRIWRLELRRVHRRGPLPYAVAIASATLFCLVQR